MRSSRNYRKAGAPGWSAQKTVCAVWTYTCTAMANSMYVQYKNAGSTEFSAQSTVYAVWTYTCTAMANSMYVKYKNAGSTEFSAQNTVYAVWTYTCTVLANSTFVQHQNAASREFPNQSTVHAVYTYTRTVLANSTLCSTRMQQVHRIWPYLWWISCPKYRIFTVYIYGFGQPYVCTYTRTVLANSKCICSTVTRNGKSGAGWAQLEALATYHASTASGCPLWKPFLDFW